MSEDRKNAVAQAAAVRLSADMPAGFSEAVAAALVTPEESRPAPKSYDPGTAIALGALLVSIAQFAWTIYSDMKKQTPEPDREVFARRVRLRLEEEGSAGGAHSRRMVEVVVDEVIQSRS